MDNLTNSLHWFEIPVHDLQRARHFYQVAFSMHMDMAGGEEPTMALFPQQPDMGTASGALVKSAWNQPSTNGTIIYLNADPSMEEILERISTEGGVIKTGKTLIAPEMGYYAVFTDSEGNTVGLHSQQ